jgi:hypothetical protein
MGESGMTFEEYWGEDPDPGKITAKHAWNAGQAAEREKYAALIAAAEAVIERWETPLWKESKPTAVAVYRMKDVIELLQMVARQMETIHFLRTQITEALQAIDNEAPDLAWRKLILAKERF